MARGGGRSRPPSPQGALRQVRDGVREGWPAGLTVLTGDDAWHLDRAQETLLGALVPEGARDFALTTFDRDKVPISTVVGAARSLGMFADRRVVLVRDVGLLDGDPVTLEAYAGAPPPGSHLIVRGASLDQRRKVGKLLASSGRWLRFERGSDSERSELPREVAALAKARGLDLGPDVVGFLLDSAAGDLYAVVSELDKIRAWAGAGDGPVRVALSEVRELVSAGATMSGWEIADAIAARDGAGAMTAARRLVAAGEEPLRLLGGIAYRTRAMVQAKALLASGAGAREVSSRLRLGWGGDRIVEGARRYTVDELLAFPHHVAEADRAFKSRGLDPGAILERLVYKLVGTPRDPRPRKGSSR